MAINLVCYTEFSDIKAENLNTKVSQDALFRNDDFLIYKVSKYTGSLEDIGIYIGDYHPKSYFLVCLNNKEKGYEVRYISNLIAQIYKNNVLIVYENEIIWNNPLE